jgi:hypothetical protein
VLGALAWTAPAWVGNGSFCSQDNVQYTVGWLHGAKTTHGLDFSFIGLRDDMPVRVAVENVIMNEDNEN